MNGDFKSNTRKAVGLLGVLWLLALGGNLFYPPTTHADDSPVILHPVDPAKTKRALEFFDLGNAYAAKGLIEKAYEYWALAQQLDPSFGAGAASWKPSFIPPKFNPNPDHPYNNMVKNLYEQAVKTYSRGDNLDTVDYLKEAEKIDPIQPQVEDFLEKIQEPAEKPVDPLEGIRESIKNGKSEDALAKLDDYLDSNPNDEEALALKDQIEGRKHASKPKKTLSHAKTPAVTPSPVPDEAAQSKADQAYNLGLDSYRQGDYATAKKFWQETLDIEPGHFQAQHNLQRLLEEHPELK